MVQVEQQPCRLVAVVFVIATAIVVDVRLQLT
jgi:hypothetical protein